jgi:GDP-4-dehydro-6-deoxy-D-mannose reductase
VKALVTGTSGFAGSYLAEFLLNKGYEVFGSYFDKSTFSNLEGFIDKIRLFQCDIRNYDSLKKIISEIRPDEIYHLAAITFVPTSLESPKLTFDTNLYGTMNLYEAIKNLKINPRILFVGSADEYGIVKEENLPINEGCPLRPINPYAVSKVSADLLSSFYLKHYNLNIIRVRPFNHTGPRQSPEFVCPNFAKQIAEIEKGVRKPTMYVGNLETKRDFTDVRDMVRAYRLALKKGKVGGVYNICSGRGYIIQDAIDMLVDMAQVKIEVKQDPARMRSSDVTILIGDNTRFVGKTNWRPQIPFNQTLKEILGYWREKV